MKRYILHLFRTGRKTQPPLLPLNNSRDRGLFLRRVFNCKIDRLTNKQVLRRFDKRPHLKQNALSPVFYAWRERWTEKIKGGKEEYDILWHNFSNEDKNNPKFSTLEARVRVSQALCVQPQNGLA